jgi:hypothetical protein
MTSTQGTESGAAKSDLETPRVLGEVFDEILQHFKDNPTHGHNCSCLDPIIREIRVQMSQYMIPWKQEDQTSPAQKAKAAIKYVLHVSSRYYE